MKEQPRIKDEVLNLRFYPGERDKMYEAARAQGFSNLSEWARVALRNAAKLKAPQ